MLPGLFLTLALYGYDHLISNLVFQRFSRWVLICFVWSSLHGHKYNTNNVLLLFSATTNTHTNVLFTKNEVFTYLDPHFAKYIRVSTKYSILQHSLLAIRTVICSFILIVPRLVMYKQQLNRTQNRINQLYYRSIRFLVV